MVVVRENGPLFLKVPSKKLRHTPTVKRKLSQAPRTQNSLHFCSARSALTLRLTPRSELTDMQLIQVPLETQ